jgi:hypothetical protein
MTVAGHHCLLKLFFEFSQQLLINGNENFEGNMCWGEAKDVIFGFIILDKCSLL